MRTSDLPFSKHLCVIDDLRRDPGARRRGVGVERTRDALELAEHPVRNVLARRNHTQRADPLAVQSPGMGGVTDVISPALAQIAAQVDSKRTPKRASIRWLSLTGSWSRTAPR